MWPTFFVKTLDKNTARLKKINYVGKVKQKLDGCSKNAFSAKNQAPFESSQLQLFKTTRAIWLKMKVVPFQCWWKVGEWAFSGRKYTYISTVKDLDGSLISRKGKRHKERTSFTSLITSCHTISWDLMIDITSGRCVHF